METLQQININRTIIKLIKGDITEAGTDAIVNAANSYLQHGGGVAGIISRKGGPAIQEESNAIGFVPVGQCAITTGGSLRAKFVIHAVGPRFGEGDEDIKLARVVRNILILAASRNFQSLAIPAISSGIFGFPKDKCANILVRETVSYLRREDTQLRDIDFYLIDNEIIKFFVAEMTAFEKEG